MASSTKAYVDEAVKQYRTELNPSRIVTGTSIGEGAFGNVCLAKLKLADDRQLEVAIKTLKAGASDKIRLYFLAEAHIMREFEHSHVIRLMGLVTKSEPIMIVTEYMQNGSLDAYLRTKYARFGGASTTRAQMDLRLCVFQLILIRMMWEIASGMRYLSEQGYVHRDLAARNILVSATLVCKVADFGLAKKLQCNAKSLVSSAESGKIVGRWTAPEALAHNEFSCASDVWSYGVVVWEVMTYGDRSYLYLSNDYVMQAVENGRRLAPPMIYPEAMYELMLNCWRKDPSERTTFADIIVALERINKNADHKDCN